MTNKQFDKIYNNLINNKINKSEIENLLLKSKINDIKINKINGNTIINYLCFLDRNELLIEIIKKRPELILITDINGNSYTHIICYLLKSKYIEEILKIQPTSFNLLNNSNQTPLYFLVNYPSILKKVISNEKIEINQIIENNDTLLTYCLKKSRTKKDNFYESALIILNHKKIDLDLDLNLKPLDITIIKNDYELAEKIIKKGVNLNKKNKLNKLPIQIAIHYNSNKIYNLLISKGVNLDDNGENGLDNPLINLIYLKKYDQAKKIIKKVKNVNETDKYINSAAHYALSHKYIPKDLLFELLLKTDLNKKNINGISPLYLLLSKHNWKNFKEILKKKKLDIFSKNLDENKSVLSLIPDEDVPKFMEVVVESFINNSDSKIFKDICLKEDCFRKIFKIILESKHSYPIKGDYFTIKNFNLVKSKKTVKPTSFTPSSFYNMIYLYIILRKYKNCCPVFRYGLPFIKQNTYLKLGLDVNESTKNNLVKIYTENNFELSCYVILWKNIDDYYIDSKLDVYLKKLLISDNIRFIVFKLTLIDGNNLHANIIIFDKQTCMMDRFDPYGNISMNNSNEFDDMFEKHMKNIFNEFCKQQNKEFLYLRPKDYISIGPQTISNDNNSEIRKAGDPEGFCLAWTFWYLEMRLTNPDIHPKILLKEAIKEINEKSKEYSDYKFIDFIRNYSSELEKGRIKLFKKLNISKEHIFRNLLPEKEEELFLDNFNLLMIRLLNERL